uniref:NAD-dependent epimerase/dehydratase domain-containing protein n=1 Tax=Fagus sylvatica TaxID=28930 RepID=A0A2N9H2Q1_FAGSY
MGKVKPNTPVALVVGVTGMVGLSLAEALASPTALGGPWKVYGAARRPKPTWFPSSILDLYITFDALNFDDTLKQLSPIAHEVTHVFWVVFEKRGVGVGDRVRGEEEDLRLRMLRRGSSPDLGKA